MTADDLDLRAVLTFDLMSFIERCFRELHPELRFSHAPYLEVIAAKLTAAFLGRGPKRLIINLPPRTLKSISVSVAFVAWVLGRDPSKHIICASYGKDLADKLGRDTRNIMTSAFYLQAFPGTVLSASKQSVDDFKTSREGGRMATSVGGVLTGRGADIIIIDDPSKPDEVLSETLRKGVNNWYDNSLLSRLNSKEDGIIILVMQRLHQDDLVGHVLEQGGWEVVSFPAIAEEDQRIVVSTVMGPFVYNRKAGEVLDPTRESHAILQNIRLTIGTYNFSAQYQQNPTPEGGAMILKEWLQYYDPSAPLPRFTTIIQSWDTANKSGELNDYSVCTTWGLYDGRYYLLQVFRKRLNYPELRQAVIDQAAQFNPNHVLIEDKGSGIQLVQELRSAYLNGLEPYEPPPQADKIMRFNAQTPKFESGRVLLPQAALWLEEYERELLAFPGTRFDDQVDSTAQALDYLGTKARSLDVWARLGSI